MALTYYIRSWDPRSTYPTNPQEGDICYTITKDQTWAPVGGVKKDNIVKEEIYQNGAWVEQGGGSSDFTTAIVTVDNSASGYEAQFYGGFVYEEPAMSSSVAYVDANDSATLPLVLYKGQALVISNNTYSSVSASGNVTSLGDGQYLVTGDCTFTLTE